MVKMAFYDDRKFLLSHIHHSFITCDDTGMCEMAMLNEVVTDKALRNLEDDEKPETKVLDYYVDTMDSEFLEAGQSYDIVFDMGFIGGHRLRSNTAQRLERLKRERQIQATIRHVQWKDNSAEVDENLLSELFPKKNLEKQEKAKLPTKSALSEALERCPSVQNNPFTEYARYDGKINQNAPTKKILIYLTMQPVKERNYGMEVVCLSSAKVQDLIGLICWQYSNERREPKLLPGVSNYCLKIAEETGEIDEDFPSLDNKEFVGKFGLPYLALVEKENKIPSLVVTMFIEEEFTKLEVLSLDMSLRNVVEQIQSRRVWVNRTKSYHVEKLNEPGIPLSLDSLLSEYNFLDFRLIWEGSSKKEVVTDEYDSHMKVVEAPLYQSYNVCFCQKVGKNYDVQLGISGEKVEINPLPQKGAAKLLSRQQKPASYYMDDIAACEIMSKKYYPGKSTFKLVYQTGMEFKKFTFETDPHMAQEIVKKVQIILDMRSSTACREYQLYRERKLLKKTARSSTYLMENIK